MSYTLASWLPWTGTGLGVGDYDRRSTMLPCNATIDDVRPENYDPTHYRKNFEERTKLVDFMLKDYYPLTEYNKTDSAFMAWQFHDPDKDAGYIADFRREKCVVKTIQVNLFGLDPDGEYAFTDADNGPMGTFKAADIAEHGFDLTLDKRRSAGIITYERVK